MEKEPGAVLATKDDNLETITNKILSGKSLEDKKSIYLMFTMTHPHYTKAINMNLSMVDPVFYKVIRQALFPTTLDKIKNFLGLK
jgi:hypothetical protein